MDGVFTFEGPHDVFLPLALAAAATDLAVMTNVAIAFPRNAVHLAHSSWDLHTLSGGQFTLGLGTQIRTHVERRFGADFDRPVARMRDTVEAVRAIFSTWQDGEPLDHRGAVPDPHADDAGVLPASRASGGRRRWWSAGWVRRCARWQPRSRTGSPSCR